ncbi:VRR-NUC domain-containing protein [Shewanella avicenniae]|uniref:VRR-NUC domain-containing protein n=1 Tax=Shewanella avicenniae TaxID=2814294 RepID=A0ABX7QMC8_9GAMM|nr:VRR-NUC domain-containing protein [Shewanella avicenniae]QSX32040.1 VRR-NUC domain-containing protein [Shewanella avicenniae]
MTAPSAVILAADYYLHNFERLINAAARYLDILPAEPLAALNQYQQLSRDARMLLVRLLSRKGLYFRREKLHYIEISELDNAANELIFSGLVSDTPPAADQLFSLLTLAELKPVAATVGINASTKAQLLMALGELTNIDDVALRFSELLGLQWLSLQCQSLLELLLLLYFGNNYQDLSQFVLSDIGMQPFEQYQIRPADRPYQTAADIEAALRLSELSKAWHDAIERKQPLNCEDVLAKLPATQNNRILERRRQRMLFVIGRQAERAKALALAQQCYLQCDSWAAQERLSRVYEKTNVAAAATLLPQLWHAAPNETLRLSVQRICKRVAKQTCAEELTSLSVQAVQYQPPSKMELSLPYVAGVSVEQQLVQYLSGQGACAYFCENSLLCGIFGLAFWDIIFAPVIGAFDNPYQRAPRDMYQPSFAEERQTLIEQRFAALATGDFGIIKQHFTEKQGLTNDWVNWRVLTEDVLAQALSNFSARFICAVCQRLLQDPAHYRSGQPDIILFESDGAPQFIEVKGPGDTLADHQGYWLNFLAQFYPASVCYVQWQP